MTKTIKTIITNKHPWTTPTKKVGSNYQRLSETTRLRASISSNTWIMIITMGMNMAMKNTAITIETTMKGKNPIFPIIHKTTRNYDN